MLDAFADGAAETGIEVGALLIVNTDHGVDAAREPAQLALQYAGRGVTAFGTAGFDESAGLHRFAGWAAAAHDAGLRVVCHAGQTAGPESVRDALDHMAPDRIAHGVRVAVNGTIATGMSEASRDRIVDGRDRPGWRPPDEGPTAAISWVDLVTQVLDIENVGDQIADRDAE